MATKERTLINGRDTFVVTPEIGNETLTFPTRNMYCDADILVSLPNITNPDGPTYLQSKVVSPSEEIQEVTADSGYSGLQKVTVNAIDKLYIGSQVPRKGPNDLTINNTKITVPDGYYSQGIEINITEGTVNDPVANKGEVLNHSIDITPYVQTATGYIHGEVKTGTPVTVTASDLVSGTETISVNTTTDVTNLKEVVTAVPPLIITLTTTVPTSGLNTISFTGLPSMPRAWTLDCAQSTANTTWNNLYRCISARYDGKKTYTYTAYKGNQGSAVPYIYMVDNGNGFTQTYNNGTLTFTTNGTGSQTYCGPFLARTYVLMAVCDNDGTNEIYRGN